MSYLIESRENKIKYLKLIFPKIFSFDNLLSRAFQNATLIGSIPNDFEGEKAEQISPFNNFAVYYELFQNKPEVKRWRLITDFRFIQESREPKSNFGVRYDGNYDKERKKPDQSDKLMINFFTDNQKVLIDLGIKKIGLRFKQRTAGINLEDYDVKISFDQLGDKSRIEKLFKESGIKVYDFEINEETNTLAFKCQGKEFKDETIITLPLNITVNNDIQSSVKPQSQILKKIPSDHAQIIGSSVTEKIEDKIGEIEFTVKINSLGAKIIIGDLEFNLNQLKILYYKYKLGKSYADIINLFQPKILATYNIHNLIINLINKNRKILLSSQSELDTKPIILIVNYARKLGILNEDFIKKLESKIKEIEERYKSSHDPMAKKKDQGDKEGIGDETTVAVGST